MTLDAATHQKRLTNVAQHSVARMPGVLRNIEITLSRIPKAAQT